MKELTAADLSPRFYFEDGQLKVWDVEQIERTRLQMGDLVPWEQAKRRLSEKTRVCYCEVEVNPAGGWKLKECFREKYENPTAWHSRDFTLARPGGIYV